LPKANKHFSGYEPWKLAKDPLQRDRLNVALFYAIETVRIASILLQPAMPATMAYVLDRLGVANDERAWNDANFGAGWPSQGDRGDARSRRVFGVDKGHVFPRMEQTKRASELDI
jgi:methionyl-tRNA synthetase